MDAFGDDVVSNAIVDTACDLYFEQKQQAAARNGVFMGTNTGRIIFLIKDKQFMYDNPVVV